ncbi:hypothetical protein BH10ACI1_BH10ACI1_22220 [soil metagenome]
MQTKKLSESSGNVFQDVLEDIFDFSGILSLDGVILSLKGKLFEFTETEPMLLIGQKFSETVYWQASENTPLSLDNAVKVAASGEKTNVLLTFRVSSETNLKVDLFIYPFQEGNTKKLFFCAQDVTMRENEIEFYKERSEQLHYAAENAEIGLWFWDLKQDKIYSTPKCNEIFEVPANEPITLHSIDHILHPEDRLQVETALNESQKNGGNYESEFRIIHSDGTINWIAARGKTYLDTNGNPLNMMGIVRKITEKKNASEELAEIYERERKARDEAEEANRMKDYFLAIVSHELRTPLNSILGWTKILRSKTVDKETSQNALETIERSALSQAKLIEDLVDSARIASGRLRLEFRPTNLYEVIRTVYNSQSPAAGAKNISLEFNAEKTNIPIFGDTIRLQQVFNNLLSNAIKFTPVGGKIEISFATTETHVVISVKDNGQGINAEYLPNIFRQFSQGDEKNQGDKTGLGLGLSITKIMVEKHKGEILAESEGIGKGAKFTVRLPLHFNETDVAEEIKNSAPETEKYLDNLNILLVEDDPDSRQVLQLVLEQCGAKVTVAESAKDAFDWLTASKNNLPNVIISDLAMPVEDGFSLMSRIRRLPEESGGKIPAIALSAFTAVEKKQKAQVAGFQKYHTKPFEPDALIEDILQVIRTKSSRQ